MKFDVFCDVLPCRLVEVLRGTCCFCSCSMMMQTAGHSATSANFYLTTWHHILEDRKLPRHCHDNFDLTCVEDVTVPLTIFYVTWIYGIK